MKKIVSILILSAACALLMFFAPACGAAGNKYESSISEYRSDVYAGENERFRITLITGDRENPFEIDGVSGEKNDYTLITVVPKNATADKSLEITAVAGGKDIKGTAIRHPYKDSFSFEFMAKTSAEEVTVTLSDGNSDSSVTLSNVRGEAEISGRQALENAAEALEDSLSPFCSKDKFSGEIYLRYIENPIASDGKYFWYVAFVPSADPDKTIAALVDVVTGEVKASRK